MAKKRTVGRPTVYSAEEHPLAVEKMARNGMTQADMAQRLGVSLSTFKNWKDEHPGFLAAIAQGREGAIDHVERGLYERAVGYSVNATKVVVVSQGHGLPSKIEKVSIVEHFPPEVAAAKFFLCNRRPKQWRERSEVKHTGIENLSARLAAARERIARLNRTPLTEGT